MGQFSPSSSTHTWANPTGGVPCPVPCPCPRGAGGRGQRRALGRRDRGAGRSMAPSAANTMR